MWTVHVGTAASAVRPSEWAAGISEPVNELDISLLPARQLSESLAISEAAPTIRERAQAQTAAAVPFVSPCVSAGIRK